MGEDYLNWLYGAYNSMMSINGGADTQTQTSGVSPKFRNPMNQNVAPAHNVQPQTYRGITDLNPNPNKENAVGEKAGTPWGLIASVAAANVGGFFDGLNPGIYSRDLLQEAGTSNSSIRGIGYQVQNNIDADRIRSEYNKNNFRKLLSGNFGGFLGGLMGKSKVDKEIKAAQNQANRTTNFNRDVAATTGMQMDFRSKYGNPEDQLLYTAAKGKPFGVNPRKFGGVMLISTPDGVQLGTPNAIGHNNETMFRDNGRDSISASTVKTGKGNGENAPVYADEKTTMFGENPSLSGPSYQEVTEPIVKEIERINNTINSIKNQKSREVAEKASINRKRELGDYLRYYAAEQEMTRPYNNYTNLPQARYGKDSLPKMKLGGWTPNAIVGALGVGASIAQYFDAKNQRIYRPTTYVDNPYERRVIPDLYGLRVNPHNMMQQLRNIAGRANYAVDTAGGLSTGQKMLQKTAIAANTQNNMANALQSVAEKNIALRSAADMASLQEGDKISENKSLWSYRDGDQYAKAHANRLGGMQTATSNFLAQLQQLAANSWKERMGRAMIGLYDKDLMNYV